MKVKQISVFLENRSGRLSEVTRVLGNEGLNIRALSLADTSDFGILRMIVDHPDDAYIVLKEQHYTVQETDIVTLEVADQPGGLAGVLEVLHHNNVNVEYLYAFPERDSVDKALMVFRFDDNDRAIEVMQNNDIKIMDASRVYTI
ncbi:amino acid-binding protein [candidate division KSB3 bacterium]|uniref:Amino acid-binding protein n=1 Tax=candidate division KSB3 bacterium TaxID=2044937 RepID=A0A2G6E2K1_9BACT|nr:MAG: amino acid-binding protein [candidate division KSB3 bacterium]PIE29278.1 MAG: amino acid-binding protein [candidate division KSB3 bacterium]